MIKSINVRENRRAINNGQSRDTGNIGHKTQNEDKQNKKNTTQKTEKQHAPIPRQRQICFCNIMFSNKRQ